MTQSEVHAGAAGYVERLAEFAATFSLEQAPNAVLRRAKYILLDTIGCMLAARTTPDIRALRQCVSPQGGILESAFLDGTAGVSLELDEGAAESKGHPSIHVIPAALSVAREKQVRGDELLTAVIVGYEVAARMGAATTLRRSFHPHGVWGTPGGAVAVGRLLRLTGSQMAQAIRIASSLAIATDREAMFQGTPSRNLWTGLGNVASILAARSAQAGFSAPLNAPADIYGRAIGTAFDVEKAARGLSSDWYMLRNYFKTHACCRYTHASIDALRVALRGETLSAQDVDAIDVHTYHSAVAITGQSDIPKRTLSAKFSIPYALGVYSVYGDAKPHRFDEPTLSNAEVWQIASRVTVREDLSYTAVLPHERPARVEISLRDGRHLRAEVRHSIDDAETSLTDEEVEKKFLDNAEPILGKLRAAELCAVIKQIETADDISVQLGTDLSRPPE